MRDITNPRLLWLKAGLFILLGTMAIVIALCLFPSWQLGILMAISIWAFCRAYYFLFYVIEHYIDDKFRFAGLSSVLQYLIQRRPTPNEVEQIPYETVNGGSGIEELRFPEERLNDSAVKGK
jgi:hypothetical protein